MKISRQELNRATLARQLLIGRERMTPLKAIERLAGMQAQDPGPPFIGLWTRLQDFRTSQLMRLFQQKKVVRTTAMRGTLHLMTTRDYMSLRTTLQPGLTQGMKSVLGKRLEKINTEDVLAEARAIYDRRPETFQTVRNHLAKKFRTADPSAMAFLVRMHLHIVQVPEDSKWGFTTKSAYTCVSRWGNRAPDPEEKREFLVRSYLKAFGPASPADATAWSGLRGLAETFETMRPALKTFTDESGRKLYDLKNSPRPPGATAVPVRLLPEFDNLVLAHVDRSRIVDEQYRPRLVTRNLRVRATLLVDGRVAGTWKLERTKKIAKIVIEPFDPIPRKHKSNVLEEGRNLVEFAEPDLEKHEVQITSS